ncbi:MAG TPA: LysR family transcriptional regulator [Methylibium sp.]|uniref:LysR family transcriptional regulator n=1 Tax=Methylibium sp. TaxID=2067992 RepID=UPI002DB85DC9|nr:LysR family transcriptional regulator [Methylibium sp.]HEU4458836.1 LysR family transcriptional regulator [Methylibium sp.]
MNYKHLHYFWVTARAGGIVRAGQQLHTTPQTLSGQIKLLEARLGRALFRRRGRNLELTDDGRLALGYADEIFALGHELERALRGPQAALARPVEFSVGIVDSLPKSLAYRLMQPALDRPEAMRLVCHEGKFEALLAQLAVHKLDLVLADEPLPRHVSVKAFNHLLGRSGLSFLCTPALAASLRPAAARARRGKARDDDRFPRVLDRLPILMPGPQTPLRRPLEAWLARHDVHPRVVGEFDDSALLKAFAAQGRGVVVAPSVLDAEVRAQYGLVPLGRSGGDGEDDDLQQDFYAISVERRITHPGVAAVTEAARDHIFGA